MASKRVMAWRCAGSLRHCIAGCVTQVWYCNTGGSDTLTLTPLYRWGGGPAPQGEPGVLLLTGDFDALAAADFHDGARIIHLKDLHCSDIHRPAEPSRQPDSQPATFVLKEPSRTHAWKYGLTTNMQRYYDKYLCTFVH
eukprot:scaffold24185_cov32-Prasinocladus_malaysianus.AAC.1